MLSVGLRVIARTPGRALCNIGPAAVFSSHGIRGYASQPPSKSEQDFSIPIVDFGRFLQGNAADKKKTAQEVLSAFTDVGFVYLVNHGIGKEKVVEVFKKSKEFFDLPLEEKNKLAWVSPESNRGYVAPGREKVSTSKDESEIDALRNQSPDLKESFEIGKEPSPNFQNNWPAHDPAFRETMMAFFNSAHYLHLEVMDSIATGLGLAPRFFDKYCDAKDNNMRLLHYPSVPVDLLDRDDQIRAGAHTDYGSITLLFQDDKGGLEVKSFDGKFVPAKPVEGAIVVNAGDLLARWSNDVIRSTEHRVTSPRIRPDSTQYPARYSIAYFCNPNWEANIECLDGCWSETRPKKYEPVNAYKYLVSRLSVTY
ncbi:hypothetical protein HK102_003209 [Quaeritorhiza haematococci]|nr:hypothetical protein HK102_003209 [Quaeritorhiza haematococci]